VREGCVIRHVSFAVPPAPDIFVDSIAISGLISDHARADLTCVGLFGASVAV